MQFEYSKRNLDSANQMVGDKLGSLVAWRSSSQSAEVRTSQINVNFMSEANVQKPDGPSLHSGHRVSHPGPSPFLQPAAPDLLPGGGLQRTGSAQPRPAGGALSQPLSSAALRQRRSAEPTPRAAGQRARRHSSPAGPDEGVAGPCHGLPGQQHAAQLARGALLPSHNAQGDPHTGPSSVLTAPPRTAPGDTDGGHQPRAAVLICHSSMFQLLSSQLALFNTSSLF